MLEDARVDCGNLIHIRIEDDVQNGYNIVMANQPTILNNKSQPDGKANIVIS